MLQTMFFAVLNMSITASIVIIVVLLARFLLKSAPKIFSYALWAVVLFRLLCPISLTSDFSLMSVLRVPVTENGRIEYVSFNTDNTDIPSITISAPNLNQTAEQPAKPSLEETPVADAFPFPASGISTLWICGAAAMLIAISKVAALSYPKKDYHPLCGCTGGCPSFQSKNAPGT